MKMGLLSGALTLLAANLGVTPAARAALPFIEDDYSRAVRDARARHVPIFLEAWAPW
ncbi:MAG TPA: hypothetical protein VKE50_06995 [Thermoanaerobaculia bacterium]|nr:hypothetical protein [Thermoanaerobaculia bacterium]